MSPPSTGGRPWPKTLKLKVRDFLVLMAVSGCNPFTSPEHTRHFAKLAATMAGSGLTAPQLNYIVRHVDAAGGQGALEPHDATVLALASTIRNGMAGILSDNVMVDDPTGTLTAQKLATLYESDVVDGLMRIVNGTGNYSAPLIALPAGLTIPPGLTFPAPFANKLVYDPTKQLLTAKTPLTSADHAALSALSTDQSNT